MYLIILHLVDKIEKENKKFDQIDKTNLLEENLKKKNKEYDSDLNDLKKLLSGK